MNIALLGWGSLVWDPGLPVGTWRNDGPPCPIEFARFSKEGRITLVLCPGAKAIPVLWAKLDIPDLDAARLALTNREGMRKDGKISRFVRYWRAEEGPFFWAQRHNLDAVIWTALPPKSPDPAGKLIRGRIPSVTEVLAYLRAFSALNTGAEEYVRRAPRQIDTPYRRAIEAEFGWTPYEEEP